MKDLTQRKYDQDGTGDIDPAEMTQALRELGVLDGVPAKEAGRVLAAEMKSADLDSDGRIDFREFIMYFERLARWRAQQARAGRLNARQNSAVPPGWDGNPGLRKAFHSFCQLGKKHGVVRGAGRETIATARMTAQQFMQLCRGAGLVEPTGTLSQCSVDVIFATCKSTGARVLTFKGWLESMAILADEVNMSFEEVAARFGAKRKVEAVDRPDTAPGRQQARMSPRMSPHMSPRMSLRMEDAENQEQDRISAQYSAHEDGPRMSPSRRHDMKDVQSKVSSAWKSRGPGSDDYTIPTTRERPQTAGSQADRTRVVPRSAGMSALERLENGMSGSRNDQRGSTGAVRNLIR
ncbi:hypothetical protein WJX84_001020 [Apatococcus fuscideae]|uniref:EF-hand domain-containing protein n=1 Tax=Apatococcus fuscideae TaxID=2026836 RepID=A0AAW1SJB8_9CHLO